MRIKIRVNKGLSFRTVIRFGWCQTIQGGGDPLIMPEHTRIEVDMGVWNEEGINHAGKKEVLNIWLFNDEVEGQRRDQVEEEDEEKDVKDDVSVTLGSSGRAG